MRKRNISKKIAAVFCVALIVCYCTGEGIAETIYAGESNNDFVFQKPCPNCELELLMSDDIQLKVSKALRSWFIAEYAYLDNWYDILWEHTATILLEPYIIQSEHIDESTFMVYCSSAISSYALFEDKNGQPYLAQGYDTVGLFSVSFEIYNQSDWLVTSVHRIENSDEELYPGAGIGTDGFPGLSDNLAQEIPDWGLDTFSMAQKYLKLNKIDAEIITW